jgi:integrase
MRPQTNSRRPYGSGYLKADRGAWWGKWRVDGRQVKRKLGAVRTSKNRDGLTRGEAERELRRRMSEHSTPPRNRLTVGQAGERYISHLEALGRKRSTIEDYRSYLRVHLAPAFSKPLSRIERSDVEAFMEHQAHKGLAPKSIRLHLSLLHGIFTFAERHGWSESNPVKLVDKPRIGDADPDIRWLEMEELEAMLARVPDDRLGVMERVLYLTAAMTGLRQGELLALRWRDVDWLAMRVRVRRNYVRGEYGTPKSRRGTRSVPLADRAAAELERHYQRSPYQADDDLVFCHPDTGRPYDRSRLLKRFKRALDAAQVRRVRFHDLRHLFGTRMAAAGVPMRTLQEWMGHRDIKTTQIYADYSPSEREAEWVAEAFRSRVGETKAPVA